MSEFEFVFVLYSLLLGLSMVELLGGFGKALEVRFAADANHGAFRLGWLTPLLAIFVMLDLLSFWSAAWTVRNDIRVSGEALMLVALFASVYFLAARLVFPSQPERFDNLDDHYFRVRRMVLALLLALLAAQLAFYMMHPVLVHAFTRPLVVALTVILVTLLLAAILVNGCRANMIVLSLLIARYVVVYLL
jgi:hypothetical protein